MWAREKKLDMIEIPEHNVFIEKIKLINENCISGENLLKNIKNDISLVVGDFRQKEILDLWESILLDKKEELYKTIKIKVHCGSGVYVRVLADDIGKRLNVPTLALKIRRLKVGKYSVENLK
jgi:tRNA U55 pseudouridine synthase TruB